MAAAATLLLPPRARFAGEALPAALARSLGRADADTGPVGMESLFDVLPRGWPAAAVTRQADAGDASGNGWLRADPAYIRPDINGARLLALGDALGLDAAASASFMQALRPVFGDFSVPIDAPVPSRWYVKLGPDTPLPRFASPGEVLGADVLEHLPQGAESRRWRSILSEAQVVLHNHPLNAQRAAAGLAPVNSVWLWGAGRLPDRVLGHVERLNSNDHTAHAFARLAGVPTGAVGQGWSTPEDHAAIDLRDARGLQRLADGWLIPALEDLRTARLHRLELRWADGGRHRLRRSHSLRFWKRPLRNLADGSIE